MVMPGKHILLNVLLLMIVFSLSPIFSQARLNGVFTSKNNLLTDCNLAFNNDSTINNSTLTNLKADSIIIENKPDTIPSLNQATDSLLLSPLSDTIFNFNISTEIYYKIIKQFKTAEGKDLFIKGWESNENFEKLVNKTDELRNEYNKTTSSSSRERIANQVIELEATLIELKTTADLSFTNSREYELKFWSSATEDEIQKLNAENDSISHSEIEKHTPKPEPVIIIEVKDSSVISLTDSTFLVEPSLQLPQKETINTIIYKVQIGSFSNELPDYINRLYKKLGALRKIDHYVDDRGVTVYTIGEVTTVADAVKLQNQIRQEGVKDAFVIAICNGKRITLKEAKELSGK